MNTTTFYLFNFDWLMHIPHRPLHALIKAHYLHLLYSYNCIDALHQQKLLTVFLICHYAPVHFCGYIIILYIIILFHHDFMCTMRVTYYYIYNIHVTLVHTHACVNIHHTNALATKQLSVHTNTLLHMYTNTQYTHHI